MGCHELQAPPLCLPSGEAASCSSHKLKRKRILKETRGKQQVPYEGTFVRLSADFSAETAGQKGVTQYI